MPVFVFTYHAYCSWLPDNPKGYVERGRGVRPPNEQMARLYRRAARHDEYVFTGDSQRLLIEEAQRACAFQDLRLHLVATEASHVHVLVSWTSDKPWQRVRRALKQSLTLAVRNAWNEKRPYFSRGAGETHIRNCEHFDH